MSPIDGEAPGVSVDLHGCSFSAHVIFFFNLRVWLTGLEEPIVDGKVLWSETAQGHPCISAHHPKFFVLGADSKNLPLQHQADKSR